MAKYFYIYFVVLIAWFCKDLQQISYWVSWGASLSLMLYTLVFLNRKEKYGSWLQQPLRPLYLPHFVFAGYMSLTSLFFFLDAQGYYFFNKVSTAKPDYLQALIIESQFLYLLGHAGFLHGLLMNLKYEQTPKYQFKIVPSASFAINIAFFCSLIIRGFSLFPALSQITVRFDGLLLTITAFAVAMAILERKILYFVFSSIMFALAVRSAILSGLKEAVIMPILLLTCFLLPIYKQRLLIVVTPMFIILFLALPIYASVFRKASWVQGIDSKTASELAIKESQNFKNAENINIQWEFLTMRLSEIKMFTQYMGSVPEKRSFYGWTIIQQGLNGLIPRAIFPNKISLENLVMQRVRENKIIEDYTTFVSAKPMIVVDGYLSFGALGAWFFCFLVGISATFFSKIAENNFGGYLLGSGIMFNGLFNIFWRGNCFEFMINNIFWSAITMYALFFILKTFGLIKKKESDKNPSWPTQPIIIN